jgi:hypothetical protein
VVLSNPFARRNKAVVRAVLAHVKAHQDLHAFCTLHDPGLLELLGIPPQQAAQQAAMAQMQAMMGPQSGTAPASKDGAGARGQPSPSPSPMAAMEPPGPAELPSLPKLPPGSAMATGVNPAAPGPGGAEA